MAEDAVTGSSINIWSVTQSLLLPSYRDTGLRDKPSNQLAGPVNLLFQSLPRS